MSDRSQSTPKESRSHSLGHRKASDSSHGSTASQTCSDDAVIKSRAEHHTCPTPKQCLENDFEQCLTSQPERRPGKPMKTVEHVLAIKQENKVPVSIRSIEEYFNDPGDISFEAFFETPSEDLKEAFTTEQLKKVKLHSPPDEVKKTANLPLLKIGEPFAKFFACCEVASAVSMRERVNNLTVDPMSRSVSLRLLRTASFLRRNIFRKGKLLGEGTYGRVFLTRTQYDSKEYALKQVQMNIPENMEVEAIDQYIMKQVAALRERDVLLMTQHPFICKLKASWVEKLRKKKLSYMLLLEYAPFGNLKVFIHSGLHATIQLFNLHNLVNADILKVIDFHRKHPFEKNVPRCPTKRKRLIFIYAAEMACALKFLHRCGVVHRDFNPRNVLIGADYHLRVADFGFTNPLKVSHFFTFHSIDHPLVHKDPTKSIAEKEFRAGTIPYCYTPEFIRKQVIDTNKHFPLDMWSLGVTLYELYTGVHPFTSVTPDREDINFMLKQIVRHAKNRLLTAPLFPEFVDDVSYRGLLSGLICEMEDRLTSSQALRILNKEVKGLEGMSVEELSESRLDFLYEDFGPVMPSKSTEYMNVWSDEGGSLFSPEGIPAMLTTFPYLEHSPRVSPKR